mgnify:CR=1 FL=1
MTAFRLRTDAFDHVPTLVQGLLKQCTELNVHGVEEYFGEVFESYVSQFSARVSFPVGK